MDEQNFLKFINEHLGKILGGFLGLLVAVIWVVFGFWRGLFILLCISAGIYLGAWAEKNEGLNGLLERLRFRRERF